jgi:hypothetical protein
MLADFDVEITYASTGPRGDTLFFTNTRPSKRDTTGTDALDTLQNIDFKELGGRCMRVSYSERFVRSSANSVANALRRYTYSNTRHSTSYGKSSSWYMYLLFALMMMVMNGEEVCWLVNRNKDYCLSLPVHLPPLCPSYHSTQQHRFDHGCHINRIAVSRRPLMSNWRRFILQQKMLRPNEMP